VSAETNNLFSSPQDHPPASWVLWMDEVLLAINKPSGLRSLPDGYNPGVPHLKSLLEPIYGRVWIVHRLDKETSGVLVLARTAEAHRLLNTQFEQHIAHKVYHALVIGSPEWDDRIVDLPLRPNGDRRHRTIVDAQRGKPARTRLHVLERFKTFTLVEACPETGRTHQIRAHLAAVGLPLPGDKLYGGAKPIPPLESFALHARSLILHHPITGEMLSIEAPYPAEYQSVLTDLRHLAAP
jgi:tRNA pseudouridine32 synthase/23S rRNA pseudouridine746 synthase